MTLRHRVLFGWTVGCAAVAGYNLGQGDTEGAVTTAVLWACIALPVAMHGQQGANGGRTDDLWNVVPMTREEHRAHHENDALPPGDPVLYVVGGEDDPARTGMAPYDWRGR